MDVNKNTKRLSKITKLMLCVILALVCVFSFTACNDDKIDELDAKVSDLVSKYAVVNTDVGKLQSDLTAANTEVSGLKTSVDKLALKSDVKTVSDDVATLKTDVTSAEGKITALQTAVAAIDLKASTASVTELKASVDANKAAYDQHVIAFNTYKTAQDTLKAAYDAHVVEYGTLVTKVNGIVADLATANTNIATLTTNLSKLEDRVKALEDERDEFKKITARLAEMAADLIDVDEYAKLLMDEPYTVAFAQRILTKYTVKIARAFTIAEGEAYYDAAVAELKAAPVEARLDYFEALYADYAKTDYTTKSWPGFVEDMDAYREELEVSDELVSYEEIKAEVVKMDKANLKVWAAFIGTDLANSVRYETLVEALDEIEAKDTVQVKAGTYNLPKTEILFDLTIKGYNEGRVVLNCTAPVNTNTFIYINADAVVTFEYIDFICEKTAGAFNTKYAIVAEVKHDITLVIRNCTFDVFRSSIYLNDAKLKLTDSSFNTQGAISIQKISDVLEIERNKFYGNGAGGVEATVNTFAEYEAFDKMFREKNPNEHAKATFDFYTYGRFTDGYWLVDADWIGTALPWALGDWYVEEDEDTHEYKGYEAGDTIYFREGTYSLDQITINDSLTFAAYNGANVKINSTSVANEKYLGKDYSSGALISIVGDNTFTAKGIAFTGIDWHAIAPYDGYDAIVNVSDCSFNNFLAGLYIGSTNIKGNITNNIFNNLEVGIGSDTNVKNLTITGNKFNCTEAVGINAERNNYYGADGYRAFVAAVKANNGIVDLASAQKVTVNPYGKFMDNVWVVNNVSTQFEDAIKDDAEKDFEILFVEGKYTIAPFEMRRNLTIGAEIINGTAVKVTLTSSTVAALDANGRIPNGTPLIMMAAGSTLNISNVTLTGDDSYAIVLEATAIGNTLIADKCTFDGFIYCGVYVNKTGNIVKITDSKFMNLENGVVTEDLVKNIVLTGNNFADSVDNSTFTWKSMQNSIEYGDWAGKVYEKNSGKRNIALDPNDKVWMDDEQT